MNSIENHHRDDATTNIKRSNDADIKVMKKSSSDKSNTRQHIESKTQSREKLFDSLSAIDIDMKMQMIRGKICL